MNYAKIKMILFMFSTASLVLSQFENFETKMDLRNLRENDKMYFQNFSNEVSDFFLINSFGEDIDFLNIDATLHFIIESINDYNNQKTINAQAILTNHNDFIITLKGISFPLSQIKSISLNPNNHTSLNSFLEYTAYLLIGNELDTYDLSGGNIYFNQASKIASEGKESFYPNGWESRWRKTKEIQENQYLRSAKYHYFYALEVLGKDEDLFMKNVTLMHESIELNKEFIGIDNNTKNFFKAYKLNIIEFYLILDMYEELLFLKNYDIDSKKFYKEAMDKLN